MARDFFQANVVDFLKGGGKSFQRNALILVESRRRNDFFVEDFRGNANQLRKRTDPKGFLKFFASMLHHPHTHRHLFGNVTVGGSLVEVPEDGLERGVEFLPGLTQMKLEDVPFSLRSRPGKRIFQNVLKNFGRCVKLEVVADGKFLKNLGTGKGRGLLSQQNGMGKSCHSEFTHNFGNLFGGKFRTMNNHAAISP